jgi:hypothetical protein
MADVEMGAEALVAVRDQVLDCVERRGLHQVDHHRRRQHANAARADLRRGVLLADDNLGMAFEAGLQSG